MNLEVGRGATVQASRYLQQLAKPSAHASEMTFEATSADIALRRNRFASRESPLLFVWGGSAR